MALAFHGVASRPPDARERRLVEKRLARALDHQREDPAALADAAAELAARPHEGTTALDPDAPPILRPEVLRAIARRAFTKDRRLLVFLSPFEG
jgi:hypothetical protein